jgi:AAA family ATP:ADP antiporter
MVGITFAFFFAVYCGKIGLFSASSALTVAVVLGSLHYCIGRSAKYTLFDAIKELAFIPLNQEGQMRGKLIIDGIGSRMGRGTSSMLSIFLFLLMGGPGESAIFAGVLAITFAMISIPAARYVGSEMEKANAETLA